MKKIISQILLVMVICTMFSVTVFAQDETTDGQNTTTANQTAQTPKQAKVSESEGTGVYKGTDGKLHFRNPDGTECKGSWQDWNGKRYYFNEDGDAVTGLQTIKTESGNKKYFFDTENATLQQSEWNTVNGKQYYSNGDGVIVTNAWVSNTYYCNGNGQKVTGFQTIGGNRYYLNPAKNGAKFTGGWISGSYYAKADGKLYVNAVVKLGKSYYGFDGSGKKMTGLRTVDGNKYYFNNNGTAKIGWVSVSGKKYYANSNGKFAKKWKKIGKYYYYFKPSNCSMAKNTTVEGYKIGSNGRRGMATTLAKMYNKAKKQSSDTKYIIIVSRDNHKVAIFKGSKGNWKNVKYWDCANGAASTPTVSGTFTVGNKGYYFDSGAARCYWYTQFCGNYLFHSVLYTHSGQLSDGRVGMALSHGCVRLKKANAKWIYDNIPRGTKVIVY